MKGFTLIELIIVIVIIGILAAIAIPKYIDLRDSANRAARDGNASAVMSAISMYYADTAVSGAPSFPGSIAGALFADGQVPAAASGTWTWTYNSDTGAGAVSTN